jgi:hypothetical protein
MACILPETMTFEGQKGSASIKTCTIPEIVISEGLRRHRKD